MAATKKKKAKVAKRIKRPLTPRNKNKKVAKKTAGVPRALKSIGVVTHFYGDIGVAIIKFTKPVKQGDQIAFRGATTDLIETIKSMQYDHRPISVAPTKKEVGVKVSKRVREGDLVYPA